MTGVWSPKNVRVKIPVAIRTLVGIDNTGNKEFLDDAYKMANVEHPNILKSLAICMTEQIMLIIQLIPLESLLKYVKVNKNKIDSKLLLNWASQIAKGMAYLEERQLVHRNLAARNDLVRTPSVVTVADFCLAELLSTGNSKCKDTVGKNRAAWFALECIQNKTFTTNSDVWAFGVTIWELLAFGCQPHKNIPTEDLPTEIESGVKLIQPEICSLDVYATLLTCWQIDAGSRPTFKMLVGIFRGFATDPDRFLVIEDSDDNIRIKVIKLLDLPQKMIIYNHYLIRSTQYIRYISKRDANIPKSNNSST